MDNCDDTDARRLVENRLGELLSGHDPRTTDRHLLWEAQYDLGLAWVHFPEGQGGLGVSARFQQDIDSAIADAGGELAIYTNGIGIGMCGPTVQQYGTDMLRARYLRRLFSCRDVWCQLFSEPGAGSDVASLSTLAVRDGDEWVVQGQKVWTTVAHLARYGLLLARTDTKAPKHRGLTAFVIDVQAPGVEVRPLRQMTGDAEFNEVFFTNARVPDDHRLGNVGDGWNVAITTLMNERSTIGGRGAGRTEAAFEALVALWRSTSPQDAMLRDRFMRVWVRGEVNRLTTMRANQLRAAGTPGPEGSIGKLATTELSQEVHAMAIDLLGVAGTLYSTYEMRRPAAGSATIAAGDIQKAFLRSRASSIEGGTSEIMRNILGERVLGLPGEPRTDRDLPWSDLARG